MELIAALRRIRGCETEDAAQMVFEWAISEAVEKDRALLSEIAVYLIAAAEGSMSRNNSEQLASELLDQVRLISARPA